MGMVIGQSWSGWVGVVLDKSLWLWFVSYLACLAGAGGMMRASPSSDLSF